MKRNILQIYLICFLITASANAQWIQQVAPKVDIIDEIRADNYGNIFAVTNIKGAYFSRDDGQQWTKSEIGGDNHIRHFCFDGDTVYSIKVEYPAQVAIHRSTDAGTTWNPVFNGTISGSFDLNMKFLANSHVMIVTTATAIFRTTDQGAHWDSVTTGLPNYNGIYNMAAGAIISVDNVLYVGFNNGWGCYRSEDEGLTWQETDDQIPTKVVYTLFSDGSKIYAGTGSQLATLNVGDTTWQAFPSGPKRSKAIYASHDTIFAAGVDAGLLRSTDGGTSWDTLRTGIQTADDINSIAGGHGKFFVGSGSGFYSSADFGTTWLSLNRGFPGENFTLNSLAFSGDTLLLGTSAGLYRTLDHGTSWEFSGSGASTNNVFCIFPFQGRLFASYQGAVYVSGDAGRTWIPAWTPLYLSVSSIMSAGSTLYATTQNGMFRSTDAGLTWEDANGDKSFSTTLAAVFGGDVYMFCQYGSNPGTWVLSERDTNWTDISAGLPNAFTDPVKAFLTNAGSVLAVTQSGAIYSTTNKGATWDSLVTNLPTSLPVISGFQFDNTLAIATGNGPFFSANGIDWVLKADGLTASPYGIEPVAVHNDTVYAIADYYMYTQPVSEVTTGVSSKMSLPSSFALKQNFPNPFNPSTTIRYQLSEKSFVTLTVYDMIGKEVAELVNEEQAAGRYQVKFDAVNLSSGIYFYTLQTMGKTMTRKMMLLK